MSYLSNLLNVSIIVLTISFPTKFDRNCKTVRLQSGEKQIFIFNISAHTKLVMIIRDGKKMMICKDRILMRE